MKKIFTLLAAALVTVTSFAAGRPTGRITINDMSKRQLIIEVDGRRYTDNNRAIVLDKLQPGNHTVQVFSQQRYTDWRGIFDRNGRKQVIYNSTVFVKPGTHILISIDRNGRVDVDEQRIRDNRGDDWYDRDNRFDPTRSAMDAQSFDMLKRALNRESFEKSRLAIAKQTIDRNNFTSAQVREMALLFAFEDSKLDLTKYAYGRTVDKNNYFQVYNVFSFSNSKEELADYIKRFRW